MNIKDMDLSVLPKNHKMVDLSKCEGTLYNQLSIMNNEYGFDINDKNGQMCCCGGNTDIDEFLFDILHRINCNDVDFCFNYYSNIAKTDWYKFYLKIDIEELRNRKIW